MTVEDYLIPKNKERMRSGRRSRGHRCFVCLSFVFWLSFLFAFCLSISAVSSSVFLVLLSLFFFLLLPLQRRQLRLPTTTTTLLSPYYYHFLLLSRTSAN